MARPFLDENSKTVRMHLSITQAEIDAVEDWRYANRVPSLSQAMRQLLVAGLKAKADDQATELLEKLGFEAGSKHAEKIGWRGTYPPPSSSEHFCCEFCNAEHLDFTEIEHAPHCPVSMARELVGGAP